MRAFLVPPITSQTSSEKLVRFSLSQLGRSGFPKVGRSHLQQDLSRHHYYSTFRAVWIRGAGVKPLRGGVAPTPPVPNSCENRCNWKKGINWKKGEWG